MRVRTVLLVLLAVNVLWASAFLGYVQRARSSRTNVPLASVEVRSPASNPVSLAVSANLSSPATGVVLSTAATNVSPLSNAPALRRPSPHQYGWRDVTNEAYSNYLADLRAAGCPEKQVRLIAAADVGELMRQCRLEHAIKTDPQWWKSETFLGVIPMHNGNALDLDAERRELMTKLLGENWSEGLKLVSLNATTVTLTGATLGGLPDATWSEVQEICVRADERQRAYANAHPELGVNADNIEVARLREQTRSELSKVLTPEQREEFLLRFSQNATKLRQELAGIEVTPEEFRRVFRIIDPMQHRMQLDYGILDALSTRQRDQLEALRDRAMKEALAPERYAQYLGTRDPIYKQAQIMASQSGLNALAIPPLRDMQKSLETRRNEVSQNSKLSAEEKKRALDAIVAEHQQIMQRILTDAKYRQ